MANLDRYTPEICSRLRQIAERRNWRAWDGSIQREEVLEDLELTYHLHAAAEAAGARAGLPAMPKFPIRFIDSEGVLDPAQFVESFRARHEIVKFVNQSDNGSQIVFAASA